MHFALSAVRAHSQKPHLPRRFSAHDRRSLIAAMQLLLVPVLRSRFTVLFAYVIYYSTNLSFVYCLFFGIDKFFVIDNICYAGDKR